jgi:energy-coupling factor transporter ATP-binding protein EcfA2
MHLHAEHPLFFAEARSPWRSGVTLAFVVAVLLVNTAAESTLVSGVGLAVALALLLLGRARGRPRLEPALAWTALALAASALASTWLGANLDAAAGIAARIACGVAWLLWLGTQLDWASLRRLLAGLGLPRALLATLDHGVLHGLLTVREWAQRREVARVRIGRARLPLAAMASVVGEGAFEAFERVEQVEITARLRTAPTLRLAACGPALALRGVRVEAGGRPLLRELSLTVEQGEWIAVCGRSGAGKTTLLRAAAGLHELAAGELERLGAQLRAGDPLARRLDGRVALLTQNPEHHFLASTVAADIGWALVHRGLDQAEIAARVEALAERLGLSTLLERPCHALSFGEQRRVALAGLLIGEPELLLLDEPTAGLDPLTAAELVATIADEIHRRGVTCLWATHELHNLPSAIARTILLRDGAALFDGPSPIGLGPTWLVAAGLAAPQPDPRADPP